MEFSYKVVMVTGAGSGIGRSTAIMFAREGATVIAGDIHEAGLKETLALHGGNPSGQIITAVLDVGDAASVNRTVQKAMADYGKIDVLVNCAGVIHLGSIETITEQQWDHVLGVNLKGTFLLCQAVIPVMKQQEKGCIINITAAASKTGGMNVGGNYVASKGGISALTIHLAKQLAPFRIRVNAVSPGPVDTPMLAGGQGGGDYSPEMKRNLENATPLGMGTPEDIAHGILFLASEVKARYITGEILDIDGGLFMD